MVLNMCVRGSPRPRTARRPPCIPGTHRGTRGRSPAGPLGRASRSVDGRLSRGGPTGASPGRSPSRHSAGNRHRESIMRKAAVALAAVLAASPLLALAREVAGVDLADTVTVDGKPLQLNGAGVRKKLFIKVYVGALYLPTRSADGWAILEADQPRHVRMVFLRGVDLDSIMGAFRDGFR